MERMKYISGIFLFMIVALTSCVYDDQSDCTLDLTFRYVYNMQNADGFAHEVDKADVYVFDETDHLVGQYSAEVKEGQDCTMQLPLPVQGKYTFVAWAYSADEKDELANFEIPAAEECIMLDDLTARLRRMANRADHKLNSLLNGTLEAEVSGLNRHLTIDMMKCTNALRVILMPSRAGQTLASEDFDIHIEGRNGWLAYDASTYQEDTVNYYPYYQKLEQKGSETSAETDEIDNAVVADLNTSRIIYGSNPRLVIRNNKAGRKILDIDLAWFLSLQAIGEHRGEWGNQEYLDRQDEYAMTFFIDGDIWMRTRIIVNGWVLSLEETELN